MYGYVNPL